MSKAASRRDVVRLVAHQLLTQPDQRSQWLQRLAAYMVTYKQAGKVDLYMNDLAHELYQQASLLTVEVVSARQLTEEVRQSLTGLLQRQTGAEQVVLHETTDQSLLGGFVARTPDAEIDASVQTKLKKLAALA
jgi:F0F1-type ATP synthase delta subunit